MSSLLSPETIATLLKSQTNGAATGTGLKPLLKQSNKMYNGKIPSYLMKAVQSILPAQFGDYPTKHIDTAPSAVFMVVFLIVGFAHLFIFFKNWSRGHRFYLTLIFALHCFMNWIGFAIRIKWAQNVTNIDVGLASTILILSSTPFLAGANLLLSQRIFLWRHPRIATSKIVGINMIVIYFVVLAFIIMGIVGASVPYLYFLSESHFNMCKKVSRGTGVVCILYSAAACLFLILAFVFKPPKVKDESFAVYQPWWIESFGLTYFVPKGAANIAKKTFVNRPNHHKNAVRVIASSTQHYNTVEDIQCLNTESPANLKHNWSCLIIVVTSILLLISSAFRCASLFTDRMVYNQTWIFKSKVLYCTHGLCEFLVVLLYLITRVDLRFYKPDALRSKDFNNENVTSVENGSNNSTFGKTSEIKSEKPTVEPEQV